jgi:hypothetical protein
MAREHGGTQIEALAHELAARLHRILGLAASADMHIRLARNCYAHWGADLKVAQIDHQHPGLDDRADRSARTGGTAPNLRLPDMTAIIDMGQAVSSEIVLERLVERLMGMVILYSGAVRGLLLLPEAGA